MKTQLIIGSVGMYEVNTLSGISGYQPTKQVDIGMVGMVGYEKEGKFVWNPLVITSETELPLMKYRKLILVNDKTCYTLYNAYIEAVASINKKEFIYKIIYQDLITS